MSGSRSELPFFRSEVLKAIVVVGGGVRLEMSEVVRNYSDWWLARKEKKKGKRNKAGQQPRVHGPSKNLSHRKS